MKIFNLLILLIVLTDILSSQPQFTSAHCFNLGDSTNLGFAVYMKNFDEIVPQSSSNHNWDFSEANWTDPTTPYVFQASTKSQWTIFHHTEINEYSLIAFPRDLFYSYSVNRDTLYYEGLRLSNNYLAKPRFPYLIFPLNYGDSIRHFSYQYPNPNQPNIAGGSITRYWIYDGFGNLDLPYGTVKNVYRIRTHQTDSTYIINSSVVYEEMIWFRQSDGIPVLRFIKNGPIISAYYCSTGPTSSVKDNLTKSDIELLPQPCLDRLYIANKSQFNIQDIKIFDELGKLRLQTDVYDDGIDCTKLSTGVYFIEVSYSDNLNYRQKFIKN